MGNVNKFMKYILIFAITIILDSCSKISDEEWYQKIEIIGKYEISIMITSCMVSKI